jgi:hypothetical protein
MGLITPARIREFFFGSFQLVRTRTFRIKAHQFLPRVLFAIALLLEYSCVKYRTPERFV